MGITTTHLGVGVKVGKKLRRVLTKFFGFVINNPEQLDRHRFKVIFHQVRHPLRVINTLLREEVGTWDHIWRWIVSNEGFEVIKRSQSTIVSYSNFTCGATVNNEFLFYSLIIIKNGILSLLYNRNVPCFFISYGTK